MPGAQPREGAVLTRVDETPAERVARWVAAIVSAAICLLALLVPVALLAGLVRFIVWCATGL